MSDKKAIDKEYLLDTLKDFDKKILDNKFVLQERNKESAGKVLGIDDEGKVTPVEKGGADIKINPSEDNALKATEDGLMVDDSLNVKYSSKDNHFIQAHYLQGENSENKWNRCGWIEFNSNPANDISIVAIRTDYENSDVGIFMENNMVDTSGDGDWEDHSSIDICADSVTVNGKAIGEEPTSIKVEGRYTTAESTVSASGFSGQAVTKAAGNGSTTSKLECNIDSGTTTAESDLSSVSSNNAVTSVSASGNNATTSLTSSGNNATVNITTTGAGNSNINIRAGASGSAQVGTINISGKTVKINDVDTSMYLTTHQDISGKQDKLTAGSNITISGNTISATNTTYSSKTAASGGTDVSLCTTGEKYIWGNKVETSKTGTKSWWSFDNSTGDFTLGGKDNLAAGVKTKFIEGLSIVTDYPAPYGGSCGITMNSGAIMPYIKDYLTLGSSSQRWKQLYATTTTISTSDERKKNIHGIIDNRYKDIVLNAKPILFTLKDDENSIAHHDRKHCGFSAQNIKELMDKNGIDALDMAAWCQDFIYPEIEENGYKHIDNTKEPIGDVLSLRYEEFIPIITAIVQDLHKENQELKARIEQLESK